MFRIVRAGLIRIAPVFLLLLSLIVYGQWRAGAYQAEFMEDSDESAHYVTGLMVHDYVAAGLPLPPMPFAESFQENYPRVALGHWPPFFYIVESLWMLIFGEGRTATILLIASISAAWITICRFLFEPLVGRTVSWLIALILVATPGVRIASRMVMTEILVALLTLVAIWAFSKLIDNPGGFWSIAFYGAAAAAVMTKATGVMVAPLPFLAVLTLRRWPGWKSLWFWLPSVAVAALVLAWYLIAPFALHEKMAKFGDPGVRVFRIAGYFTYLASQLTWPGLATALAVWAYTAWRVVRGDEKSWFWVLSLWVVVAGWFFHVMVGAWHARHLVAVLPFLLLFAGKGLRGLWDRWPQVHRFRTVVIFACVVLAISLNAREIAPKTHRGLDAVAATIVSRAEFAGKPLLIVSDPAGEGGFVAEVAMRDNRPDHQVRRGYKVLTEYTRMGQDLTSRFGGPDEVMRYLHGSPDTVLIFDPASRRDIHGQLIEQMLAKYPQAWNELFTQPRLDKPSGRQSNLIRIFKQAVTP